MTLPLTYGGFPGTPGLSDTITATLDSGGNGTARISNQNSATLWIVRQVSVITSPRSDGCTCTLTPPIGIIDTSYFAGTGDVAGGDPPIFLRAGDFIDAIFENGPASGVGIVTYYYDEVIV